MNELIVVKNDNIGGSEVRTVNARDLHSFLEVKKDFSGWIKKQIERARLAENRDFVVFAQKGVNLEGGRPTMEYHLTLEAGKHISMLSNTEKGFEVREYFIECEKAALAAPAISLPGNYKEALIELVSKVEENERLQLTLTAQAPTVAAFDRIALADGLLNLTNTAKTLQINPNKILFNYMNQNGWIYRRTGGKSWVAYQEKIQQGFLSHKVTTVQTSDGREKVVEQVLVTPRGLTKLASIFGVKAAA